MERAIRVVSVECGYDPRDFILVAFGGCGGLHACEIAEELGIASVLIPQHAGVLSALGMLMADATRDYSAGVLGLGDLEAEFVRLESRARRESNDVRILRTVDLRYRGQSFELNVPFGRSMANAVSKFHLAHRKAYGYSRPGQEVEAVTIRVRSRVPAPKPRLCACCTAKLPATTRGGWIDGRWHKIPQVLHLSQLATEFARRPSIISRLRLDYFDSARLEIFRRQCRKRRPTAR